MLFALIQRKHSNRLQQSWPFPLEIHQSPIIQRLSAHSLGRAEEHWGLYAEVRGLDKSFQHSNLAYGEEMWAPSFFFCQANISWRPVHKTHADQRKIKCPFFICCITVKLPAFAQGNMKTPASIDLCLGSLAAQGREGSAGNESPSLPGRIISFLSIFHLQPRGKGARIYT